MSEAQVIADLTEAFKSLLLYPGSGSIANDLVAQSLDKLASLHMTDRAGYLDALERAKTDAVRWYTMHNSPLIKDARQFLETVTGSNIVRHNPATGEYEAIK